MQKRKILAALVALCISAAAFPSGLLAGSPDPTSSHIAVEKSLNYLTSEGTKWIEDRGCVSCHQVPAMLWSLSLAKSHGFDLPDFDLGRWSDWSIDPVNFVQPNQKENVDVDQTLASNIDTMVALLLALDSDDEQPWKQAFLEKLRTEQAEDGSWKACGQLPLQKRPKEETAAATTLWTTLTLIRHRVTGFDRKAAVTFADSVIPAKSTEWYAVRLLVANEDFDEDSSADANRFRGLLLQHQNDDGGWGWIVDQPSDGLATGMALYSLSQIIDRPADSIDRARRFLVQTQTESGNWQVSGTKSATKDKFTPTSNYWGTAWAVIGLLSSD